MSILKNKLSYVVFTIILVLILVIFSLQKNSTNSVLNFPVSSSVVTNSAASHVSASEGEKGIGVASSVNKTDKQYTSADSHEMIGWMERTGRFTAEEKKDYQFYDDKTLDALAKNGDLKAIDILGDKYLIAYRNKEKSRVYHELGAINGSITSVSKLAVLAFDYDPYADEAEIHKMVIEIMALNKVIAIRGDEVRSDNESESFSKTYEQLYKKKLELSSDDNKAIDNRALEIYRSWQQKRIDMGLGEFDNSQPQGAVSFFGFVKEIQKKLK